MDEDLKNLLKEEIVKEFGDLKKLEAGSEKHKSATEDIQKLMQLVQANNKFDLDVGKAQDSYNLEDRKVSIDEKKVRLDIVKTKHDMRLDEKKADSNVKIEEEKARIEKEKLEIERLKIEEERKAAEKVQRQEKFLTIVGHGVNVGIFVLGLLGDDFEINKGFTFERTGTITSPTFRNYLPRFRRRKV